MSNCTAVMRASNIVVMDYPLQASVESALGVCDEVVIVRLKSYDQTRELLDDMARQDRRIRIVGAEDVPFDQDWQERAWAIGSEYAKTEWLCIWDADDVLDPVGYKFLRLVFRMPSFKLIRQPVHHLYGTPNWRECRDFYPFHTRFGRRSVNYRMVNMQTPGRPVCEVLADIDDETIHAHLRIGTETAQVELPIVHLGWARHAKALAISQAKHFGWYRNDQTMADAHIPEVRAHDFNMRGMIESQRLQPYTFFASTVLTSGQRKLWPEHSTPINDWMDEHSEAWTELDRQANNAWRETHATPTV